MRLLLIIGLIVISLSLVRAGEINIYDSYNDTQGVNNLYYTKTTEGQSPENRTDMVWCVDACGTPDKWSPDGTNKHPFIYKRTSPADVVMAEDNYDPIISFKVNSSLNGYFFRIEGTFGGNLGTENSELRIYINNELNNTINSDGTYNISLGDLSTDDYIHLLHYGGDPSGYYANLYDNVTIKYEIPDFVFLSINCTSCNPPNGDNESPYTTSDTTPSFIINANINSECRIDDENKSYYDMIRNCTPGGTKEHTCTLSLDDELIYSTDYVYISCAAGSGNTTTELEMDITDLETTTDNSIEQGILNSTIGQGAAIYSERQVYLVNSTDYQLLSRVDRVAEYNNQSWIFNYALENETMFGLFNITPAIYSLDMTNLSGHVIEERVKELINSSVI